MVRFNHLYYLVDTLQTDVTLDLEYHSDMSVPGTKEHKNLTDTVCGEVSYQ